MDREGVISSINTYDRLLLTWGVGFGGGAINTHLWPMLPQSVKSYLIGAVPARFRPQRVLINASVRLDHPALDALIHVSEHAPHQSGVMKAQFLAFCRGTMGMSVTSNTPFLGNDGASAYAQGQPAEFADPAMVYWSSRLAHYLRLWHHPEYAREAMTLTGPDPSLTAFISATIHLLTRKAIEAGYVRQVRGRYKLDRAGRRAPWVGTYISRFQNRMAEMIVEDDAPAQYNVTGQVRSITPAFSSSSFPFLVGRASLDEIPQGHMYAEQRGLSARQVDAFNDHVAEARQRPFSGPDRVRWIIRQAGLGQQMSNRRGSRQYYDLGPFHGSADSPRYQAWAQVQPIYGAMPPELTEADDEEFEALITELERSGPAEGEGDRRDERGPRTVDDEE